MKISSIAQPYISGVEFSDGFFFDIQQDKVYDRLELLDKMVAGKSVLHVGCVDHPISSQRIRSDRWLHGRLTFSKKLENHIAAIWNFIHDYNYQIRVEMLKRLPLEFSPSFT